MRIYRTLAWLTTSTTALCVAAWAQSENCDQPAVIRANEVEHDLTSGQRLYRGDVSVKHCTLRILADQINMTFAEEILTVAVATGKPAVFRQRPIGKSHDVVGEARTIELDDANQLVTFHGEASLRQDRDTVSGKTIVYNMRSGKLTVRGATETIRLPEGPSHDSTSHSTSVDGTGSRARIVVRPDSLSKQSQNSTDTPSIQIYSIDANTSIFAKREDDAPEIGILPPNSPITVHSQIQDWLRIFPPVGVVRLWVYGKFLEQKDGQLQVRADDVRVRTHPNTDSASAIVGFLNRGDIVVMTGESGEWKAIELPETISAWIPADHIQTLSKTQ